MRRTMFAAMVGSALAVANATGLSFGPGGPGWDGLGSLPALDPAEAVPFPDWVPSSTRGNATGGRTNVLGLAARWVFPPPWGRPGIVEIEYSNRLDRTFRFECALQPHGLLEPSGILLFRLGADGGMLPLAGFPRYDEGWIGSAALAEGGCVEREAFPIPAATVAAAAGSEGLLAAYAGRSGEVAYWSSADPLSVPAVAQEPGVAGSNEWAALKAHWVLRGLRFGADSPVAVLEPYPELARSYPGVVCDASLPETLRLGFAAYMPPVDAYDPAVLAFVTNAVDKTAPLVIAALRVLRLSRGGTPEEGAARDAVGPQIYAMSQDAQHPLLFRLHAAHTFPMQSWYKEFLARTEPEFKLVCAHGIREYDIEAYTEAKRDTIRDGLEPLLGSTTPFIAGPLQDRFPANVTIGQAAQGLLDGFEARWTANPPPE